MPSLEIQSPQPTRQLKRKASQLDFNLNQDHSFSKKRSRRSPAPPDVICDWLQNLNPPDFRSRSDTYLFLSSHRNRVSDMSRPWTAQPSSDARLPTPQSYISDFQALAAVPASVSFNEGVSRLSTPVQSYFSPSVTKPQIVDDERFTTAQVKSPCYRDDLRKHGVIIDSYGLEETADEVKAIAQAILQKPRCTPEPNVSQVRTELARAVEKDEGPTRDAFIKAGLLDTPNKHRNRITTASSLLFNRIGVPHTHGFNFTPLPLPKSDLQYGFQLEEFTLDQLGVMVNHRIDPYAKPSTGPYWPFFLVELKATSRGGTHYVGENQNAGTGAHCVESVEKLFQYTAEERPKEKSFDSMVFSCVADAQHGTLWVHWRELKPDGRPKYLSTELRDYAWKRGSAEILDFRRAIRNIIDHGVDHRLHEIKEALASLLEKLPVWNAEDKQARARSFSDANETEGSQGKKKKKGFHGRP